MLQPLTRYLQVPIITEMVQSHGPYLEKLTKDEKYCLIGCLEEVKLRTSLALTPTARQGLDQLAHALGLSRSEFVERIGRQMISIQLETRAPNNG